MERWWKQYPFPIQPLCSGYLPADNGPSPIAQFVVQGSVKSRSLSLWPELHKSVMEACLSPARCVLCSDLDVWWLWLTWAQQWSLRSADLSGPVQMGEVAGSWARCAVVREKKTIRSADNRVIQAEGIGNVLVARQDRRQVVISFMLYVHEMKSNLITMGQLLEKWFSMNMVNDFLKIYEHH